LRFRAPLHTQELSLISSIGLMICLMMIKQEEIHDYFMESVTDKIEDALKEFEGDYDIDELLAYQVLVKSLIKLFFLETLSLLFCIMMLSIIIPTYEAKIIRKTIEFLQGNLVGKKMLKLLFPMVVVPMRQWR
jgi:hypothetical protein